MAKPTRQSTHPISMLQNMMRLKLLVSRLAVICGMVSRLIASTMPTMRRVATMVIATKAIRPYSTSNTGSPCDCAKVESKDMLNICR